MLAFSPFLSCEIWPFLPLLFVVTAADSCMWPVLSGLGRVQQLAGRISQTIGTAYVRQVGCWTTFVLIIQQNKMAAVLAGHTLRSVSPDGSRCHLLYWIRMNVVQQLTCLNIGRPSGPAYLTGELLNTPQALVSEQCCHDCRVCRIDAVMSHTCVKTVHRLCHVSTKKQSRLRFS